jgi:hypothetical protein
MGTMDLEIHAVANATAPKHGIETARLVVHQIRNSPTEIVVRASGETEIT